MSSIPPATTEPMKSVSLELNATAPVETAPSATVAEGPTAVRIVGFIGLFLAVLGLVVIIATRATGTARWVPEGRAFVLGAIGAAMMLFHAVSDRERDVRRLYGLLAAVLLLVALGFGLLPGPFVSPGVSRTVGYYLMPWGLLAGLLSLLFALPFVRYESDETLREFSLYGLLGVGGMLCLGVVLFAILRGPDFLAGPGVALAFLGLAFLGAYMSQIDTSDGIGYLTALALGLLGGAALLYVFGRTVFPTVLYDGPAALRTRMGVYDKWAVAGRILVILAALGAVVMVVRSKFPTWLKGLLALVGIVIAGVFILAALKAQVPVQPRSYLVPGGLIFGMIGLAYLAVGIGACSDSQFVTLTRRELSAYFFSPIGYLVLGGMVACQWLGYWEFYDKMADQGRLQRAVSEPIVSYYLFDLIPILCVVLPVPALTMRLLSEESRTGSLEVLFTVPVNEWSVVLSKFFATWAFFLICWLPSGLFLIAMRLEAGAPFDYRPLLSFYAALAVCSAAFISFGLFFSSLTSNQIIAAVLTFMVLVALVVAFFVKQRMTGINPTMQIFLSRLSFIDMWFESLRGQLPIRDILVWASASVFGLFLTVKVLEARKWN